MSAVPAAIVRGFAQLGDRAVLRVAAKSIAVTLAVFAGASVALYAGLDRLLRSEWVAAVVPAGYAATAQVLVWLAASVLAFWLLLRVVALAVLQLFADDVVAAVEARHYPALATRAQPLPLHREVAVALRGLTRALGYNLLALPIAAVLVFTAIGPALVFLGVNAVLLGRELTDMAWLRHCAGEERANPVPRPERILLGAAIAAMMAVPVLNLVAPLVGAAAGTHLVLRRIGTQR
ncbi:EI24 domain-containing protein [Porphyrobacter sp. AAP82]|uniref:EI24 domain-containing protein n=1 Tax=Porphyrobacter sp. AAP82 TaxID=1248917 RepID=UPI0002E3570B|nr:EI24 domain-containing protein [Porphyrobacter sp. AAP82]